MHHADSVEGDVDAAGFRDNGIGMTLDGRQVQRVNLRHLSQSAGRSYVAGDLLKLGERAASQENLRSLAGENPRRGAADCTAAAVDDRRLVLEKHVGCSIRAP